MDFIAVLPNKNIEGFDASRGFDHSYVLADVVTAEEAFNRCYSTDAHFVPYILFDDQEEVCEEQPRVNKKGGALQVLRDQGVNVGCLWTAIDWDTGSGDAHKPWSEMPEGHMDFMLNILDATFQNNLILNQYHSVYVTKKGLRIVYKFSEPILPEEYKGKVGWIINTFHEHGVECDKLVDWCRLFRMPHVMRDNEPTWEQDYCQYIDNGRELSPDDIPDSTIEVFEAEAVVDGYEGERPRGSQIPDIVDDSRISKIVRKWVTGREAKEVFFGNKKIPEEQYGGRNNAIMAIAGSAIGALYQNFVDFKPDHVFAFMWEAISKLDEDLEGNDDRSWEDIAWDIIVRVFNQEKATVEGKRQEMDFKKQKLVERHRDRIRESSNYNEIAKSESGVNEDGEEVMLEDVEVAELEDDEDVTERAILCLNSKFYFIMNPEGGYSSYPVTSQHLASRIVKTGMEDYLPVTWEEVLNSGEVKTKQYSPEQLFMKYGEYISSVEYMPMKHAGYLANTKDHDNRVLRLPLTMRDSAIEAEYSEDVDTWLQALCGHYYEDVANWIGWALAIDEGPIAALSMLGFPGIGKDLFVHGLSEAFTSKMCATDKDMTTNFNAALMKTCVLWVNEGWPLKSGHKNIADSFRELVTNTVHWVEEKFCPKVKVFNPLRIIMTANNDKMVRRLAQGIQTHADREAIGIRVFHFEAQQAAKKWLDRKGGSDFTAGWIASQSGKNSNFTVAKHFLWLYEQRHSKGKRLLFEGGLDDELRNSMTYNDNNTLTGSILLEMLSKSFKTDIMGSYVEQETGEFWVTREGVKSFYLKHMSEEIGIRWHNGYLEAVNHYKHADSPRSSTAIKGMKLRWNRIELMELMKFVESQGIEGYQDVREFADKSAMLETD